MHARQETPRTGEVRPRRFAKLYAAFLKRKRVWHLWTLLLALFLMSSVPHLALT
jgi:hypothetical protein